MTTSAAGYGIGSPLAVRVGQVADYTALFFDPLGMRWTPPAQDQSHVLRRAIGAARFGLS